MRRLALLLTLLLPTIGCGGSSDAPASAPAAEAPPATEEAPPASSAPAAAGEVVTPEEPPAPDADPKHTMLLDPTASTIGFTSVKNGDAPVPGKFLSVHGGLTMADDLGAATGGLQVWLGGVDSGLELRDLRIGETFFGNTSDAPRWASISLTKLTADTATLEAGGSTDAEAELSLDVIGTALTVPAAVTVSRGDDGSYKVVTKEPAKVSIDALGLGAPLKALMTLCAHKSIDDEVTITADLTFKPKG